MQYEFSSEHLSLPLSLLHQSVYKDRRRNGGQQCQKSSNGRNDVSFPERRALEACDVRISHSINATPHCISSFLVPALTHVLDFFSTCFEFSLLIMIYGCNINGSIIKTNFVKTNGYYNVFLVQLLCQLLNNAAESIKN